MTFSWTYAKSLGFSLDGQSKFSIIYAFSKRRYQFCMEKSGSVETIPMMKWSLNVLIECPVTLSRCIPGGASWKSMSLALIYLCKVGEAPFSSIIYAGLSPLASRCSWRSLETHMKLLSNIAFMGRINILLLYYSYKKIDPPPYWRLQGI